MHELSIAQNLVSLVQEALEREGGGRVVAVRLQLGRLSGVVAASLLFCYDLAAQGTPLEGSRLEIEDVPVTVYCPACDRDVELPDPPPFACPTCGTIATELRAGRELKVDSVEVDDGAASAE